MQAVVCSVVLRNWQTRLQSLLRVPGVPWLNMTVSGRPGHDSISTWQSGQRWTSDGVLDAVTVEGQKSERN